MALVCLSLEQGGEVGLQRRDRGPALLSQDAERLEPGLGLVERGGRLGQGAGPPPLNTRFFAASSFWRPSASA